MEKTYATLLLIVLAYGVWKGFQMWRAYRQRLHVKLEAVPAGTDEARNPELPGRVRVVPRVGGDGFSPDVTQPGLRVQRAVFPAVDVMPPTEVIVVGAGRGRQSDDEEARPALFEKAAVPVEQPESDLPVLMQQEEEPDVLPVLLPEPEPVTPTAETIPEPVPVQEPAFVPAPEPTFVQPPQPEPAQHQVEQQDLFAGEPLTVPAPAAAPRRESVAARASALYETEALEPVNPLGNAGNQQKVHEEVQDVIAVHVVANGQPFHGEALLRCILSYGLRFGEMSIFHRHEKPTGQGLVLFSMAKAVEPGTFDLEGMTGEMIPGVSFFQSLPGVNSIHAYDIMMDTAKRLAGELGGEVLDQQQNPLTRQLIEHYRERVTEFERRRLMERR